MENGNDLILLPTMSGGSVCLNGQEVSSLKRHYEDVLPFGSSAAANHIKEVSQLFGDNRITEAQFDELVSVIASRRERITSTNRAHRVRAKLPDQSRKRMRRRRWFSRSDFMPYRLRSLFDTGCALAVIAVLAWKARRNDGVIELTNAEIADLAGCGKTSVQNTIRILCEMNLVAKIERRLRRNRNLPNQIVIISTEWLKYLGLRRRLGGFKNLPGLKESFIQIGINQFSILVGGSIAPIKSVLARNQRNRTPYSAPI